MEVEGRLFHGAHGAPCSLPVLMRYPATVRPVQMHFLQA